MSTLRKSLKRPELWLALMAIVFAASIADAYREPALQITARMYMRAVRAYQFAIRPILSRFVECRYRPTCSEYSIGVVQRYGIGQGLVMTLRRIAACNRGVSLGTIDPP
jgi:putative membrane protein insertion efficiency factor